MVGEMISELADAADVVVVAVVIIVKGMAAAAADVVKAVVALMPKNRWCTVMTHFICK